MNVYLKFMLIYAFVYNEENVALHLAPHTLNYIGTVPLLKKSQKLFPPPTMKSYTELLQSKFIDFNKFRLE